MTEPYKRIYRSRIESKVSGVCGGLGIYFGIDPVLIRLALMVLTVATGVFPGIVVYLAAWVIMPEEPLPLPARPTVEQHQQGRA